jgi:DNA-binding HxlR family transcriptional regulator
MQKKKELHENCGQICPIVYSMELIGGKWKIPLLWNIASKGSLHYNELKRLVSGITNTALTRCLRELEQDGLVKREDHKSIPPSVEYSLSEDGASLVDVLNGLFEWGVKKTAEKRK